MKITIISLMLVLFAIGCSKKESASEPSRFAIGHGDITPQEITTNIYNGTTFYIVGIKLSSAKETEWRKLAHQYPNREVEVAFGSKIEKMRLPTRIEKPPPQWVDWAKAFTNLDDARAAEADLKKLSQ